MIYDLCVTINMLLQKEANGYVSPFRRRCDIDGKMFYMQQKYSIRQQRESLCQKDQQNLETKYQESQDK